MRRHSSTVERVILVLVVTALWLPMRPAISSAQTAEEKALLAEVTLAEYSELLRQIHAEMPRDGSVSSRSLPQSLRDRIAKIDQIHYVQLEDGSQVTVSPLLTRLSTSAAMLDRLDVLLAQLDAAPGDDTEARLHVLQSVLARPQFQARTSLWLQIWRWLRDQLGRLPWPKVDIGSGTVSPWAANLVAYGVAGLFTITLVLLLAYWFRGLIHSFIAGTVVTDRQSGNQALPTASAATVTAERAAATGDYRHAVRQLYLAALLTLHEHGIITYSADYTNREVLDQLSNTSKVRAQLQPMTEIFDHIWYGVREPDASTFTQFSAAVDQLRQSVRNQVQTDTSVHPAMTQ